MIIAKTDTQHSMVRNAPDRQKPADPVEWFDGSSRVLQEMFVEPKATASHKSVRHSNQAHVPPRSVSQKLSQDAGAICLKEQTRICFNELIEATGKNNAKLDVQVLNELPQVHADAVKVSDFLTRLMGHAFKSEIVSKKIEITLQRKARSVRLDCMIGDAFSNSGYSSQQEQILNSLSQTLETMDKRERGLKPSQNHDETDLSELRALMGDFGRQCTVHQSNNKLCAAVSIPINSTVVATRPSQFEQRFPTRRTSNGALTKAAEETKDLSSLDAR